MRQTYRIDSNCVRAQQWTQQEGVKLDKPPEEIIDTISAILGSCFHLTHHIVVGVHHAYKKAFFVVLSEAVYAWDEQEMNTLVDKLKSVYELDEEKMRLFRYFCR